MNNKNYVAPVSDYLMDKLVFLDAKTLKDLQDGVKEIRSVELVHTVKLPSLLGEQELLKANNDEVEGMSSFPKGRLEVGAWTAFDEVGVFYGFSADNNATRDIISYSNLIQDPFAVDVTPATGAVGVGTASSYELPKQRIPVAFQNSFLQIIVGTQKLYEAAVSSHLVNNNRLQHAGQAYIQAKAPKIITPDTKVQINYRGAAAGVVPVGNHFIRMIIRGVQVVTK